MRPEIRVLTAAEVACLVDWAGAEGWNPGSGDAEAFRAADPDGFLGCFAGAEMAAGIAAVAYDEAFGFVGLYICRPDHRGKGFGKAVWDAGIARLGTRTIGLDGVPEQQANYRAMGFSPAYETLRYTGRLSPAESPDAGWTAAPFEPAMLGAVRDLDRACFPAARPGFLAAWLEAPRQAVVAMREGVLGGFGALRRCLTGCKVGPLFAADDAAASVILAALAEQTADEIGIDVPEPQHEFRQFLLRSGLTPGFRTARMYRGRAPELRSGRVYGVTTLELG